MHRGPPGQVFLASTRDLDLPRLAIARAASFDDLLAEVRRCRACEQKLPLGPRPIVRASVESRILIVGQAPSRTVHETGVPWNDRSGDRLRDWLGVSPRVFYDPKRFAIVPMGFCFPGTGPSGDLPPRKECSVLWFERLLAGLGNVQLTLLIGQYAQRHFLGAANHVNVTRTVAAHADFAPRFLPLPHPSPRNQRWLADNAWFARDVLPLLKLRVREVLELPEGATP